VCVCVCVYGYIGGCVPRVGCSEQWTRATWKRALGRRPPGSRDGSVVPRRGWARVSRAPGESGKSGRSCLMGASGRSAGAVLGARARARTSLAVRERPAVLSKVHTGSGLGHRGSRARGIPVGAPSPLARLTLLGPRLAGDDDRESGAATLAHLRRSVFYKLRRCLAPDPSPRPHNRG
jgi:hypothetical protein